MSCPTCERVEKARDGLKRDWGAETYQAFLTELDMLDDVDPEVILENLNAHGMARLARREPLAAFLFSRRRLDAFCLRKF